VRLLKQVIEQNGQYVNIVNKEIQQTGNKSRIVSTMSISKSMDNMNITETNLRANHVDDNFQIDFESINTLGAQFEINRSKAIDDSDFANIQENIEEYSGQIQKEISRINEYSKAYTITVLANAQTIDQPEQTETFDELCEYDSYFIPGTYFSIKQGSNEIPRFSCSSH
jgi:hypothetical protein